MSRRLSDLIARHAGPVPACFDSLDEWRMWLTLAHAGGQQVLRRVDVGRHRNKALGVDSSVNRKTRFEVRPIGQQAHCADCTQGRQRAMQQANRCFPVKTKIGAETMSIIEKGELVRRYELARDKGVPREQAIAVLAAVHDLPELTMAAIVAEHEYEQVAA